MLFFLNKALSGLKLLFDPAVEGNPYADAASITRRKEKTHGTLRFALRRRLVLR